MNPSLLKIRALVFTAGITLLITAVLWGVGYCISHDIKAGISEDEDSRILPNPPCNVTVSYKNYQTVIQWQGTGLDTISVYRVYKVCTDNNWELIGEVSPSDNNISLYQFTTSTHKNCRYGISVVDTYGNEGPKKAIK
jgi:hypothetical protein